MRELREPAETSLPLFRLTGVGVVETDMRSGRLVRVNAAFAELLGYTEAELTGMTFRDITHPDDLGRDEAAFLALRRGEVHEGRSLTRVRHKDGHTVWLELHVTVLGEGDAAVNLAVVNDVTERKRREANQELLLSIAEDLSRLSSEEEIVRSAGAKLAAHLGLTCYHYVDVDEARAEVTVRHFWHAHDVPGTLGTFPVEGFVPPDGLRRRRAGETDVVHDVPRDLPDDAATAALKAGAAAQRIGAYVVVPYSLDGRWRAYFAAADSAPRRWTGLEVELIEEVACRVFPRVERVRAERALRGSEARFRGLVEPFSQAVWEADAGGRVVADSPSWRAYTGQSLESWLGGGWAEAVHPDDRLYALGRWREAMRAGTVVDAEFRLRSPDGGWRWTNVRAVPLLGDDGLVERWTGLNIDISERKRAEDALRESEAKYRTLFETIDEGFCVQELIFDEHGRVADIIYRDANAAFEQHTGLAGANGKRASEIFPHIEQHWFEALTRVYQTGVPERTEAYNADTERWLTAHYSRVGGAGSPFVATVFNNITERKRAEEVLRESEEHGRFLLRFSDALRAEPDADAVANRALGMLLEQLHLDRCYVGVYRLADDRGDFTHQVGNDRVPPVPEGVRLSDFPEALRVALDKTLVIDDVSTMEGLSGGDRKNLAALGMRALVAATLRRGEHDPYWSIVALSARPRRWTPGEVALIEAVTERTWAALERARAEEALRDLNETLEKRVEERTEELRRSERRFVQAFNVGPVAACISTLGESGSDRENFLEVNDEFVKLTGYARDEAVGKSARDLGMWSSAEDRRKLERAGAQEREFHNLELQLRTKAGEVKDVLLSGTTIRLDGHHGLLKLFYDVTETKRSERQLVQAIQEVMSDTAWFSQSVLERFARLRGGDSAQETVELSPRERQVLEGIARGQNNAAIAAALDLKPQTVRNYVATIYEKLGIHTRAEAVVWARERGLAGV